MKDQQTELIKNQDVHNMKLHEEISIVTHYGHHLYLRVPNGWIVTQMHHSHSVAVFIPYSKEFENTKINRNDYSDEVEQIIKYFNLNRSKYGISNHPLKIVDSRKRIILARLKERFVIKDFKIVINAKFREWANNPDMAKYLTPETLFRPSKFAKYLDEAKTLRSDGKGESFAREPKTSV